MFYHDVSKVVLTKADLLSEEDLARVSEETNDQLCELRQRSMSNMRSRVCVCHHQLQSHAVVCKDILTMGLPSSSPAAASSPPSSSSPSSNDQARPDIVVVSASTGGGVTMLWNNLLACTRKDVVEKAGMGIHQAAIK